ncbi:MAG: helix-turn-helix domain-containing protein [Flavobacterium sp. JAD_PAG50586_2]|nr:MAG: helix-turn-helix domain-containing protein [Flavobacterium sp. JAD_PAG50586_2]
MQPNTAPAVEVISASDAAKIIGCSRTYIDILRFKGFLNPLKQRNSDYISINLMLKQQSHYYVKINLEMKRLEVDGIGREEFIETINEIKAALDNHLKNFQPQPEERFLTRKEVADMFDVSIVTVSNWSRSGVLLSKGMGNRVYFLMSDIQKQLIPINGSVKPKKH